MRTGDHLPAHIEARAGPAERKKPRHRARGGSTVGTRTGPLTHHFVTPAQDARCAGPSTGAPAGGAPATGGLWFREPIYATESRRSKSGVVVLGHPARAVRV